MRIEKNTVVSLNYRMLNREGQIVEEAETPISYLHGGYDGIFPAVEEALHEKEVGHSLSILMEPEDAFGGYDAELMRIEPKSAFPEGVTVGMQFEGGEEESDDMMIYTVTDVTEDIVVVDGNHPYAGMALQFECTVVDIRSATTEEMMHGHVHGPDGHHH
ncbi:FKBP-type peptidyl-prolyl cis-trans isomerase [Nitrosomonas mobilis]|uniref:peptidylprolyl isomerase n=1 Tax=Nitrosomonas mobilis TaxID=51642 RepID=A0A1G5SE45_9PROT|nr:peptidylprolyl isomerase [Nitrosomonas mobilis]SCZ85465.1 FKBP-type peptidyl-prolyl cis-trans isomerase SlyD [Nitrosomonas mobilis]